jgi:phosphate uptake regulator
MIKFKAKVYTKTLARKAGNLFRSSSAVLEGQQIETGAVSMSRARQSADDRYQRVLKGAIQGIQERPDGKIRLLPQYAALLTPNELQSA